MGDLGPLLRQGAEWAAVKGRLLDTDLLADVLVMRERYDELSEVHWPTGSVERLLLVTWPAYGPQPPDEQLLSETLDTYWMFLRATGRLAGRSASPAELRKEVKRSLPKMAAAYDDPARHSQGRVLGDFGRSIGIELDTADTIEQLQERLAQVQLAWNDLPREERIRRMPDPSPKSARGRELTRAVNKGETLRRGDPGVAVRQVREAPFLGQCLALREWVGSGREVTVRGLLKVVLGREAYHALDLWRWEREQFRVAGGTRGRAVSDDPELDAAQAEAALGRWRSSGDCLPLDRLWWPLVEVGLVDVDRSRARAAPLPETDHEWHVLGVQLVVSLCRRLGVDGFEPMLKAVAQSAVRDAAVPMAQVREWWAAQSDPDEDGDRWRRYWDGVLDYSLFQFADCGIFTVRDDRLAVTEFGRDCVGVLLGMLADGEFEEY